MKLSHYQLYQHLSKQLSPIYLLTGDEALLQQDALQMIRKKAKSMGFNERIRYSKEEQAEELYALLHTQSLFAEKRLLEFDFRDILPNKSAAQILQEYAEQKPATQQNNIVVIQTNKADDKLRKSNWFAAISKASTQVAIWPITRENLPKWLLQKASSYQLKMDFAAATLLADFVEGNLLAAAQALEKCYLWQPDAMIDTQLIQQILTDESHYTIFDLTSTMLLRDEKRMLHILENFKNEGVEPVLIVWALTRELRILADIATRVREGETFEVIFRKHAIFPRRQVEIRQHIAYFTPEFCQDLIIYAAQIDKIIKGALAGNVWQALQLFCLRIRSSA